MGYVVAEGEYIPLIWDGTPDALYIRGHVNYKDGLEILIQAGVIDPDEITDIGLAEHCYGRWSIEPGENGNQHCLRDYSKPGRGRFKITMFGIGIFAKKGNNATTKS